MADNLNKINREDPEIEARQLPLVPLRDMVLFPHMITPVFMGRASSIKALSRAMETDKRIFLATQNDPDTIKPMVNDISPMGTQARITQMLRLPDGTVKALVEGECRGRLTRLREGDDFVTAEFTIVHEVTLKGPEAKAAVRTVVDGFEAYAKLTGTISKGLIQLLGGLSDDPGKLADTIAAHMPFKVNDKRQLLNISDVEERLFLLLKLIHEETEVFAMSQKIKGRVKEQMDKLQKKHYLNEQMTAIKREMGEDGESSHEFQELENKIKRKRMPKEAAAAVRREFDKLVQMSPMSSEATVVRNYIDWLVSLPWYRKSRIKMNLADARQILDKDHYGLEKPKERILEYLAVQMMVKKIKGPILCLVGPPGVGKTSLARSIARSTGRSFARISLGGVRDEAEIRGHRRTYIGAMPGKIIQTLKKTGYSNPVFCLDEVDKMSTDFRGDPSSALLEVLDPEQNQSFNDHYLDVDYDLSDILFVTTANTLHNIPAPLRDRMEVIQIPGYTEYEKERIAHGFLIPKQLAANGLVEKDVVFSKQAILTIIRHYTREAGVRNLEREISSVCRKIVKNIVEAGDNLKDRQKESQRDKPLHSLSVRSIHKHLGPPKFRDSMLEAKDQVGIVNGLAWTQAGGELLTVETVTMPGKGNVSVTGKLGDVMKESASAAVSYVRSRHREFHIQDDFYRKLDIHIHVPEGAIPKDGPSAGIAMCTALVSALTGRPVDRKTAMTGEITLRGRVLPVGGLKEKLIAAHATGITRVIISKENKRDIVEIPASIQRQLEICLVEEMGEVIELALLEKEVEKKEV
ncbi:MAG: endopeptidase La [Desulfobacterium sp.]|jgi:ATP-dependent Lon protease|nr:endopeptidase La [Desulfobacterium sp.]